MKKLTDKEIQRLLEEQSQDSTHAEVSDMKTYQLLFEALKEEPSEGLPMGFVDQVVREAIHISVQKQVRRYWLLTSLSILIALCTSVFFLLFYQQPSALLFFDWLIEIRWIILFTVSMFALIQWADYFLINKKQMMQAINKATH